MINVDKNLATASSILSSRFLAEYAADGLAPTLFHTKTEMFPWLQLELPSEMLVSSVDILNRGSDSKFRIQTKRLYVVSIFKHILVVCLVIWILHLS